MLLLKEQDIKKVFSMKDAIEADKEAFKIFSEKKAQTPLRNNFRSEPGNGNILFMPGYIEELNSAGIKIVSVFPDNVKKGLPSVPAQVLLVSGETGEVVSLLDGTYVTQLRTGAASGAAIDLLAKKNCKKACLIGTGGQAKAQLEAILCARDLEEVYVFSRNEENRKKFVDKMSEELKEYNTKIVAATSSDEAVEDADIVVLCTTSETPVFDADKIKKGALISGVGSFMKNMNEIDPKALVMANKIYFDSKEAVLSEAGCLINPLEQGLISEDDFTGDLGEVVAGTLVGRENDDEIIVFKSVGIGVQDLVTGKRIYDRAIENGVGLKW